MDGLKKFIRKVFSNQKLMWNGCFAVIFIIIGPAILLVPSLTGGDRTIRIGFGGMLLIYGLYRFWTFYMDINGLRDE